MSEVSHFEAEAEATRGRIVDAVGELSERLSPRSIVREAKAEVRQAFSDARDEGVRSVMALGDQAADAVDRAERFVVANPGWFVLGAVAVGVAATASLRPSGRGNSRRSLDEADDYARYAQGDNYAFDAMHPRDGEQSAWRRAARAAADASDAARHAIARAGTLAGAQIDAAGEQLASVLDRARDGISDTGAALARTTRSAAARSGDAIADNPEAAIALAAAAGVLLALIVEGEGLLVAEA